jgi:D-serine dehydratase
VQDPLLGPCWKGWPHGAPALRRSAVAAQGWNVLAGDLPLPLAVIRRRFLQGNLRWMQDFADAHGVSLAPHGKTTLSPQLFAAQLSAGAWGITFANVTQARIGLAAGVQRCLIANQVFAEADLAAIASLLPRHAGARLLFLVDSPAQVDLIEAWFAAQRHAPAPFEVLLEIGLDGGRSGCRDPAQALALARRLGASAALRLVGIECYEGLWATGRSADDEALVRGLMQRVSALAAACDAAQLFAGDEVILSAGGSSIFDLVAPRLKATLSRPVRGVLRSGCYVTHDHGNYRRYLAAMNSRLACGHGLDAALEVWALVQSCPEPGLAILGAGKRDLSYDIEMPIPVGWCPRGERTPVAAPGEWRVSALNDQHAYLRFAAGAAHAPQVGDRIGLGISHPCTTFDKWRWMALVDEGYDVVDVLVTHF